MEDLILSHLNVLLEYQGIASVYLQESNNPVLKKNRAVDRASAKYARTFEKAIREILKQQGIDDLDPRILALGIIGMCNWTFKWYRKDGPKRPEEIAKDFARLVTEGLFRDTKPAKGSRGKIQRSPQTKPSRQIRGSRKQRKKS